MVVFQQDQLIENTERLERSSRKLDDSYRMCIETEQVSDASLSLIVTFQERHNAAKACQLELFLFTRAYFSLKHSSFHQKCFLFLGILRERILEKSKHLK